MEKTELGDFNCMPVSPSRGETGIIFAHRYIIVSLNECVFNYCPMCL